MINRSNHYMKKDAEKIIINKKKEQVIYHLPALKYLNRLPIRLAVAMEIYFF